MLTRRVRFTSLLATAATAGLLLGPAAAAHAQQSSRMPAVAGPVRLVPRSSIPSAVSGLHRFFGTIELAAFGDGLTVVNRLPLERYLLGLEEVPRDWPMAALRAQAIAARTYALFTLSRPPGGSAALYGFDICASIECQVFSGAEVLSAPGGRRWARAVAGTAGRAVLYGGLPILARYHSTSGGRTFDNAAAFPGETSYPYLRSVQSKMEKKSPLYRWRTTFRLRRLERMLRRSGHWAARESVDSVRTVAVSGSPYPDVVISGEDRSLRLTADGLRAVVRDLAPRLYPQLYPPPASTSSGRLPETLPSERFEARTRRGEVMVAGRGWGHGVGMSQWGAHGLAESGATADEILRHYYSGTTVERFGDPGLIEVGVDWARPQVAVTGSFTVVDGRGRTVVDDALGTWRFTRAGAGSVSVQPPEGWDLPLRVGVVRSPRTVEPGQRARIVIALSRPAELRVSGGAGPESPAAVANAGRRTVRWRAPTRPGDYRVSVEADDGTRVRSSEMIAIRVAPRPAAAGGSDHLESRAGDSTTPLVLLGVGLLAASVILLVRGTMKR